jgi:hypothetical protein
VNGTLSNREIFGDTSILFASKKSGGSSHSVRDRPIEGRRLQILTGVVHPFARGQVDGHEVIGRFGLKTIARRMVLDAQL